MRCRPTPPSSSGSSGEESGRAVATLVRLFGDIDIAEEAVQEAFVVAVERWPVDGLPPNPGGWIITTARNRAIDRLRRESSRDDRHAQAALARTSRDERAARTGPVSDDRLRLIFTCCHPALAPNAQVALTLRLLGGLADRRDRPRLPRARGDDGPAARAGQAQDPRRQHPLPRARRRRAARPAARRARRRLPDLQRGLHRDRRRRPRPRRPVRRGHPPGPAAGRADARRARGARACWRCCCSPSRAAPARTAADGSLVLLADQDRSPLGPRARSPRARRSSAACLRRNQPGPYQIQAAIAAVHSRRRDRGRHRLGARSSRSTTSCSSHAPTPVVALNRAVAVAEVDGPDAGARRSSTASTSTATTCSTPPGPTCWSALGRPDEARRRLRPGRWTLATNAAERRFLEGRRDQLGPTG